MQQQPSKFRISLTLRALLKQSTIGDCKDDPPPVFDLISRDKWTAWRKLKGMSKAEAKARYEALVSSKYESLDDLLQFTPTVPSKEEEGSISTDPMNASVTSKNSSTSLHLEQVNQVDIRVDTHPGDNPPVNLDSIKSNTTDASSWALKQGKEGEIVLGADDATLVSDAVLPPYLTCGAVLKQRGGVTYSIRGTSSSWNCRWLVLDAKERCCRYYEDPMDTTPRGRIQLTKNTTIKILDGSKYKHASIKQLKVPDDFSTHVMEFLTAQIMLQHQQQQQLQQSQTQSQATSSISPSPVTPARKLSIFGRSTASETTPLTSSPSKRGLQSSSVRGYKKGGATPLSEAGSKSKKSLNADAASSPPPTDSSRIKILEDHFDAGFWPFELCPDTNSETFRFAITSTNGETIRNEWISTLLLIIKNLQTDATPSFSTPMKKEQERLTRASSLGVDSAEGVEFVEENREQQKVAPIPLNLEDEERVPEKDVEKKADEVVVPVQPIPLVEPPSAVESVPSDAVPESHSNVSSALSTETSVAPSVPQITASPILPTEQGSVTPAPPLASAASAPAPVTSASTHRYIPPPKLPEAFDFVVSLKLAELEASAATNEGWRLFSTKDDMESYAPLDGNVAGCKGKGFLAYPVSSLREVITDVVLRGELDTQFEGGKVMRKLDEQTRITYMRFRGMFTVSGRENLIVTHWRVKEDGTLLILGVSLEECITVLQAALKNNAGDAKMLKSSLNEIKKLIAEFQPEIDSLGSKFVRANLTIGGWVISPVLEQTANGGYKEAGANVVYVMNTDLKGSIPRMITTRVVAQQASIVATTRGFLVSRFSVDGLWGPDKLLEMRQSPLMNVEVNPSNVSEPPLVDEKVIETPQEISVKPAPVLPLTTPVVKKSIAPVTVPAPAPVPAPVSPSPVQVAAIPSVSAPVSTLPKEVSTKTLTGASFTGAAGTTELSMYGYSSLSVAKNSSLGWSIGATKPSDIKNFKSPPISIDNCWNTIESLYNDFIGSVSQDETFLNACRQVRSNPALTIQGKLALKDLMMDVTSMALPAITLTSMLTQCLVESQLDASMIYSWNPQTSLFKSSKSNEVDKLVHYRLGKVMSAISPLPSIIYLCLHPLTQRFTFAAVIIPSSPRSCTLALCANNFNEVSIPKLQSHLISLGVAACVSSYQMNKIPESLPQSMKRLEKFSRVHNIAFPQNVCNSLLHPFGLFSLLPTSNRLIASLPLDDLEVDKSSEVTSLQVIKTLSNEFLVLYVLLSTCLGLGYVSSFHQSHLTSFPPTIDSALFVATVVVLSVACCIQLLIFLHSNAISVSSRKKSSSSRHGIDDQGFYTRFPTVTCKLSPLVDSIITVSENTSSFLPVGVPPLLAKAFVCAFSQLDEEEMKTLCPDVEMYFGKSQSSSALKRDEGPLSMSSVEIQIPVQTTSTRSTSTHRIEISSIQTKSYLGIWDAMMGYFTKSIDMKDQKVSSHESHFKLLSIRSSNTGSIPTSDAYFHIDIESLEIEASSGDPVVELSIYGVSKKSKETGFSNLLRLFQGVKDDSDVKNKHASHLSPAADVIMQKLLTKFVTFIEFQGQSLDSIGISSA
jgi:acyl-CoA-binding protein